VYKWFTSVFKLKGGILLTFIGDEICVSHYKKSTYEKHIEDGKYACVLTMSNLWNDILYNFRRQLFNNYLSGLRFHNKINKQK